MAGDLAQDFLFQRIRELVPQHVSLVDVVSDLLSVSNDSAYRRIRGETPLVLEEAKQLCDKFQLSLDQLLQVKNNSTLFQTSYINNTQYTFESYLNDLLQQLKYIEGFIKKEIIFLTKDLHIFANMLSEPFFAFRYFFWNKSIISNPEYATKAFSPDCLTPQVKATAEEMAKTYCRIPSTEIWNTEAVNSIILQVEYYKEAGIFSNAADIRVVYDSVLETLDHLKEEAELGIKFYPGENPSLKKQNLRFFYNRVVLGDNTILVTTDHIKTVYLNYNVLNYMITRDERFCANINNEMEMLIRRSTMISNSSERQRNSFFNILASKIEERKKHL
ncbi:MAG: helix-turn-helix domain-containing protein [Chitinophagaceae bacterium]